MEIINVAFAGGPCTGKTVGATSLFVNVKAVGLDYDLIGEECRRLKRDLGDFRSPFERVVMWLQQDREEGRATALNGFITDQPLFHLYVQALQYAEEERDEIAIRELYRLCRGIINRYDLIVIAKDPNEIPFKNDQSRTAGEESARKRHQMIRGFVELFLREKPVLFVRGSVQERTEQVLCKLEEMRGK